VSNFPGFYQVLKTTQKKIGSFFLPHGVLALCAAMLAKNMALADA